MFNNGIKWVSWPCVLLLSLVMLLQACQMPSSQRSSSSSAPPSSGSPSSGSAPGSGGASGSSGPSSGGMPGSGGASSSGAGGSSGSGDDSASGESLESLDSSLDQSLGEFDDMILNEGSSGGQEGVDVFDPISQSSGGGPLFEESPLSDQEMSEGSGGGSGGGGAAAAGAAGSGGGESATTAPVADLPADIDDGKGDDIVARQIREAAMVEMDPALREKLWQEYRRYNEQNR